MMNDKIRESIILGALLHDIGKFWQRCEEKGGIDNASFLDSNVRNTISNDICPGRKYGDVTILTHQHVAWTYQFLTKFESKIYPTGTSDEESILQFASGHHRSIPSTSLQTLIQVADWISAAQDRNGDTGDIKDELSRSYNYRKQRQRPVFENLFRDDYDSRGSTYRYNIGELKLDEILMPQDFKNEDRKLSSEYQKLWENFVAEFINIPNKDFNAYLETLLCLLQKYTWCIPSSTNDSPDISLYDHSRSTASIATCLYDYLQETNPSLIQPGEKTQQQKTKAFFTNNEKFALLITADISGIQKFIYQISSVKAATALKGRSFYLQLISDAAARYFLTQLNLPYTNLIYSSGGNFFLLAPNTKKVQLEIARTTEQINRSLLAKYDSSLFLGVGYEELSGSDFIHNLSEKWEKAIRKANSQKRRKFRDSVESDWYFFQPRPKNNAKPCDNCGADCNEAELSKIKEEEEEKYCPLCREFIQAGTRLKSAQILLEFVTSEANELDYNEIIYPITGVPVGYILTGSTQLDQNAGIISQAIFKKIYYLNQADFIGKLSGERFTTFAWGFKFYGGNHLPLNDQGEPSTFDYLAGVRENKAKETISFKRLGILRMDVDNLGKIFSKGFLLNSLHNPKISNESVKAPYSISRISTLSSMLDIFFCGYLNTLHQQNEDFKNNLYLLYSGGDDLFIVGRWDKVIDFAALIREEFKKFTCHHPDISISGGIVLTPPKYPIHRSADLAGDAESASKSKRLINGNVKEKDAISFLGKTLSWNDFEVAKALKDDLVQWIENPSEGKTKMNRGLINRLNQIYSTYQKEADLVKKQEKEGKIKIEEVADRIQYNKWRWRLVYSLKRFLNQNENYNNEIENIQKALIDSNIYRGQLSEQPIIEYLDLPVKWAEYQLRTNKKED